jgi:hypothetical protein
MERRFRAIGRTWTVVATRLGELGGPLRSTSAAFSASSTNCTKLRADVLSRDRVPHHQGWLTPSFMPRESLWNQPIRRDS